MFVQNLKPGAIGKLGFPIGELRKELSAADLLLDLRLWRKRPLCARKAYDLLVQAEVGLASVTGGPDAPARVGFSVADIGAGMNAYQAILEALIARGAHRRGRGDFGFAVRRDGGMDDGAAAEHEGGHPPKRIGLAHAAIAPYGVFKSRDGADILISIQNDREWRVLAEKVLGDAALAADPNFATIRARVDNRAETDAHGRQRFARMTSTTADGDARRCRHRVCARQRLRAAVGRIRICAGYSVETPTGPVAIAGACADHWRSAPLWCGAEAWGAY